MASPELRELNRQADYAATNLSQQQSAAWLAETRKHWAEVIGKAKITLD